MQVHLLSSLLFGISANIDNFTVGIAYGIKKIKIGIFSNLLIAIISAVGTFLSMSTGTIIVQLISSKLANILGSVILILIGIWFVIDFFTKLYSKNINEQYNVENNLYNYKELLDTPEIADINNSGNIDVKESISLALALTINNIGVGIGASITGLNILLTTGITFIFSIIAILLGCLIGRSYLSKLFGEYAPLVSGIMIIILGAYELFI
jgi:putative sporulation protein YtaF